MSDQGVPATQEAPPEERPEQEGESRGFPLKGWFALAVLSGALMLGLVMVFGGTAGGPDSPSSPGSGTVLLPAGARGAPPVVGKPAPEILLETLDGGTASLAGYRGQAVMVNFWATWCPPCRAEMPDIQQVYEERKGRGFVVFAVNIQEAKEPVSTFVSKFGLTFPILLDTAGDVTERYGINGLPSSFFIRRDGTLAEVYVGPLNKTALSKKVDSLLQQP